MTNLFQSDDVISTLDIYKQNSWDDIFNKYKNNSSFIKANCQFHKNITSINSQNGEETIIEEIFKKINFTNKEIVDIGAWDGVYLSNTLLFKRKYGCTRLLIEGNETKVKNAKIDEKIVHSIVSAQNVNTLLKDISDTFDLLSIDIDGNDYYVLKAMEKTPRVIILEYHTGLPNQTPLVVIENEDAMKSYRDKTETDKDFFINNNHNGYWGANMLAYINLLKQKGYKFVTSIGDNLIFVIGNEFNKLNMLEIETEYIIQNYFQPNTYWGKTNRPYDNTVWCIPK